MRLRFAAAILFTCLLPSAFAAPVLMISIDGLHPDYVLNADKHGIKVPHLRSFVIEGAYASGVVGVLPTITYPSHTTLVTGVAPAQHGILANLPFDPMNTNKDGWYWYAEDLRAPTL
jgi:predicted AlkP superfamily pyrophosphatase or phosphodiesterase